MPGIALHISTSAHLQHFADSAVSCESNNMSRKTLVHTLVQLYDVTNRKHSCVYERNMTLNNIVDQDATATCTTDRPSGSLNRNWSDHS